MARTERKPKIPEKQFKEERDTLKSKIKEQNKMIQRLQKKIEKLENLVGKPDKISRPKKKKKEKVPVDKKEELLKMLKERFGKK